MTYIGKRCGSLRKVYISQLIDIWYGLNLQNSENFEAVKFSGIQLDALKCCGGRYRSRKCKKWSYFWLFSSCPLKESQRKLYTFDKKKTKTAFYNNPEFSTENLKPGESTRSADKKLEEFYQEVHIERVKMCQCLLHANEKRTFTTKIGI